MKWHYTIMSSYRRILYHIIFRTKEGAETIDLHNSSELYAYISGIIKNKGCFLYRINGVENHLHILSDLHPSITLAEYMREIKVSTSVWMKESGKFPRFRGWAIGYAALTYSWKEKDRIINYIKNQREHHRKEVFEDELRRLLKEQGIMFDERYFP